MRPAKRDQRRRRSGRAEQRRWSPIRRDSECFDSLTYKNGVVTASFIGPAAGVWEYEMSLAEAREWFSDDSLGGYFNDNVREPTPKGN